MNYTGHCLDRSLGRPNTAPVAKTLQGKDSIDEAKRTWDRIRFGKQTNNIKDVDGRYSMTLMKSDRARGLHHVSYQDNAKTHPLIKFENQVLEYKAVYEEKVRTEDGAHIEPHDCLIRFFAEDSTLEVIEKPVANSGRTEFRLVKRTRISKPAVNGSHYTAEDLFAGNRIVAYGMSFLILNGTVLAESYTSQRFPGRATGGASSARPATTNTARFSVDFGDDQEGFDGPGSAERPSSSELMTTRKERVSSFLTQQDFAQQIDNVCLDLVWDDRDALYGDLHELKLKYYLLDDTVDVFFVESKKFETKYSGSRTVVKRQKLQKETELSVPLQGLDARMRLTSAGGSGGRTAPKQQQYLDCEAPGNFYHWSELLPGTSMTVLGRKAKVVGFGNKRTERFYEKMMGAELVRKIKSKFRFDTTRELPQYEHQVPDWLGYGSYEDSMRSVKAIAPQAPPSASGNSNALRFKLQFKAKLLSAIPSDQMRIFIVSFFCEDGTIMVYESSPRNSGRASYTFAARSKYIKSFDVNSNGNEPEYYGPKEVYVGSSLVINGHHFEVTEAAPGTVTFMEAHAEYFA